jgi:peptide/nickel transport system substrate-binding protein
MHHPGQGGLTRRDMMLLGAAAKPSGMPAGATENSTIRVTYPAAVATLDPAKFRVGGLEYNYAYCVLNRLTTQDAQLRALPDLATGWESSHDPKTWTFHLRPGVKFHDGKPLDAADVVFTYTRLKDKAIASVMRAFFSVVFVQNFACAISQKVRNFTALPLMLMDLSTTALAT